MEIWAPAYGFESYYEVSTYGNVRRRGKTHNLSLCVNGKTGVAKYYSIGLWTHNKPKYIYVHRLVAQTFIPNPKNKPYVNHIDADPSNNHVENLEWVTAAENTQHAVSMDLMHGPGADVSRRNISEWNSQHQLRIKSLTSGTCYPSLKAASAALNVSEHIVKKSIDTGCMCNNQKLIFITKEEFDKCQQI